MAQAAKYTPETTVEEVPPILPVQDTITDSPATPPVVLADAKNPFKSKINWLGIILTLIGALQLLQEMKLIDTFIPDPNVREQLTAIVLFAGGILTLILRTFFTFRPTTLTQTDNAR